MILSTNSELTRRRFTRDDYHAMAAADILAPDARVELLDGEVLEMSPIGPRHGEITNRLNAFFSPRVAGTAICRTLGPPTLSDSSEPEPHLQILAHHDDFYTSQHPGPKDVLLLIEGAESSLERDRGEKLALYAQAGIAERWIVDLTRNVLIAHRRPKDDEYASVQHLEAGARVAPEALPDLDLDAGDAFV